MTYLRASGTAAAAPPQAGEAVLTIRVVEGTATPAARPTVTLRRTDVSTPVAVTLNENPARFTVPAGTYEASAHVGASPETLPVPLALSAGESKDLTINTATGTLEVALLSGGKTLTRCPNLNLFANGKLISASSEIPAKFRLPAGTFTGRLEFAPSQVFEIPNLTVTPGETARKSIEVPCTNLTVKVQSRTPHPYVEVATTSPADTRDDLLDDAESCRATPAVVVRSIIELGAEKLTQQVVVRAVQFDAVESRRVAPHRGRDERLDDLMHLGRRQSTRPGFRVVSGSDGSHADQLGRHLQKCLCQMCQRGSR
jgi:hypothetical protein